VGEKRYHRGRRKKSQFSLLFLVSRVGERIGADFGRIKSQFSKESLGKRIAGN
jgi:hypothetical protein